MVWATAQALWRNGNFAMISPDPESVVYKTVFELKSNAANEVAAWLGYQTLKRFRPNVFQSMFPTNTEFHELRERDFSKQQVSQDFPFNLGHDGLTHVARSLLFQGMRGDIDEDGAHEMLANHADELRDGGVSEVDAERLLAELIERIRIGIDAQKR